MTEHFGSEFGLSKDKVLDIIKNYDYGTPLSCADNFGNEKEQAINGLLNEYVNLHMTKEFIDLRKEYRRISANEPQYLDALKKFLFPEDYVEQPVGVTQNYIVEHPVSVAQDYIKAYDPIYRGLVMALFMGTPYRKSQICALLNITDSEYNAIKLKQSKLMEGVV